MKHTYSVYIDGPEKGQRTKLHGAGPVEFEGHIIYMRNPDAAKCEGEVYEGEVSCWARVHPKQTVRVFYNAYPEHTLSSKSAAFTDRINHLEKELALSRSRVAELETDLDRVSRGAEWSEKGRGKAETRVSELEATLAATNWELNAHLDFGNLFQPGGRFYRHFVDARPTALGKSAVVEGGKWLVDEYDKAQLAIADLRRKLDANESVIAAQRKVLQKMRAAASNRAHDLRSSESAVAAAHHLLYTINHNYCLGDDERALVKEWLKNHSQV